MGQTEEAARLSHACSGSAAHPACDRYALGHLLVALQRCFLDAERIGQTFRRTSWAQRLGLRLVRRPGSEIDDLEGRGYSAILWGYMSRIGFHEAGEQTTGHRSPRSGQQGICQAQTPQVAHQCEKVGIADYAAIGVDDRQGKAGTLKQRAPFPHMDEGSDARGGSAEHMAFRSQPSSAQLGQGFAAQSRGKEKSIRGERPPDLGEGARNVIHALEAEQLDKAAEAFSGKGHGLFVEQQCRAVEWDAVGSIKRSGSAKTLQ